MAEDAVTAQVWEKVLGAAVRVPGIRVEREEYLRTMLEPHVGADVLDEAIASTPAVAGVPPAVVRKAARESIVWHRASVTSLSFAAGLPGGWWAAGTIPADILQYFGQVGMLVQKLGFLYGWPSFFDAEGGLDDQTELWMTLFIGVAMGSDDANDAIDKVARGVEEDGEASVPHDALTRYAVQDMVGEIARWLGTNLAAETFARALSKLVPLVGGGVSGALSWVTFSSMAERLDDRLAGLAPAAGD